MKKLLTVVFVMVFTTIALGSVDVQVVLKSFTSNIGGTDILTVSLQAVSNYPYPIVKFSGAFDMGANLSTQIDAATDGGVSWQNNTFFPDADYAQSNSRTGSKLSFAYIYDGSTKKVLNGTQVPQTVVDIEIKYKYDNTKQTTFNWSSYYSVDVVAWLDLGGGGVWVPISVTGGQVEMPPELVDRTLPVQLSNFIGKFEFENGITLKWKTQSETDCAGFHVVRSDKESGPFAPITLSMIPAQGNTSAESEYTFVDKNVKLGSKYWYRIQEISTFPNQFENVFYGNLEMATLPPPEHFALNQNYPNPFNPNTRIMYALPENSNVVLKVFDMLGKEVRTLINEQKQPGVFTVEWDGRDNAGLTSSSGIYFYKLTAGDKTEIRKMMKVQ